MNVNVTKDGKYKKSKSYIYLNLVDTRKRIRDKRKELTLFHHPVCFINYLKLAEPPREHFRNRLHECPQKSGLQLRKGA